MRVRWTGHRRIKKGICLDKYPFWIYAAQRCFSLKDSGEKTGWQDRVKERSCRSDYFFSSFFSVLVSSFFSVFLASPPPQPTTEKAKQATRTSVNSFFIENALKLKLGSKCFGKNTSFLYSHPVWESPKGKNIP